MAHAASLRLESEVKSTVKSPRSSSAVMDMLMDQFYSVHSAVASGEWTPKD